jgi:hypothetical protein
MPPGLSGCTFDAGLTLQGGVLVAAGPPAAAGQQYPVALVLRCLSPGVICTDSYLVVNTYSTTTRALRWVLTNLQSREFATICAPQTVPKQTAHGGYEECHPLVNMGISCTMQFCAQGAPADAALFRQLCRLPRPCGMYVTSCTGLHTVCHLM